MRGVQLALGNGQFLQLNEFFVVVLTRTQESLDSPEQTDSSESSDTTEPLNHQIHQILHNHQNRQINIEIQL